MESDPSRAVALLDRKIEETRNGMWKSSSSPVIIDYLARKLTMFELLRSREIENLERAKAAN